MWVCQARQAHRTKMMEIKMYSVYVLKSESKKFQYVGQCRNIDKRLTEHNKGKVRSTKPYVPMELDHIEEFKTREEAVRKEKYYKSSVGRGIIKKILAKAEMAELVDLSAVKGIEK